jgi:hypothetical protein
MKKRTLTDGEWRDVFAACCRSKRGEWLSEKDRALVDAAFASDPKRYSDMQPDVFDATVPAGSTARARR